MNSLSAWTDQVNYYQGLIRASWETSADTAIQQYVDSITTSDAYNDVNAYKDYVSRELNSQKLESLMSWEESANFDLLANRNEFVAKLNSSRVDEVYLTRLGMQDLLRPTNSEIEADRLREQLNAQANQWSQSYQQGYQNGLTDFGQSVQSIEDKYNTFLATMNQSEQTFTDNLTAINNFKTVVKQAIGGMMTSFQTELDRSCDVAEGCQYKNANQSWNSAGDALNDFVSQVNARLNDPTLDPSTALTQISQAITTYLTQQTTGANSSYNYYNDRIITYQLSSTNIYRDGVNGNDAITRTVGGTYDYWSNISRNNGTRYNSDGSINNNDIGHMVYAIRTGNQTLLKDTIQAHLGGASGRSVVNIAVANVFTADLGELNKFDQLAYISKNHTRGNWLLEGNAVDTWHAVRPGWIDYYKMDHITYGIAYTMRDQGMADHATYWSGNLGSLSNQLNQYNTNINPAISNWESQVQNYNNFYTAWQTQAQTLRDQARQDYENSLADLETKKQTWLNKIGQEYQDGVAKWQGLENQINQSSATGNLSAVRTNFQASVQSIGVTDFSTGTNTVLANYNQSYNDLTSREFTFTEVSTNQAAVGPYQYLSSAQMLAKENSLLVTAKNFVNSDSFMLSGVAEKLGISKAETVTETTRSYNIFSAAADKKVETSLSIKDKDLASVFQTTANGVYQYSQLLSTNENNANAAIREQEKLINQMSYGIRWEDRSVGRFDDSGNFVGEDRVHHALKLLTDSKGNAKAMAACESKHGTNANCFGLVHGGTLNELKKMGYEYQDGMIVRSFTDRNTLIKLGMTTGLTLTDAEKRLSGSCYVNPASCNELRQDYTSTFNRETLQATLTKKISNGRIGGRDSSGKYISGTQEEKRYVSFSTVKPVSAPNGKDLFDAWDDSDWKDFSSQSSNVMNDFYTNRLASDTKMITAAVASINAVETINNKKFQAAKQAQEAQDSLVKDLLIAYISGGMAGVKGAIKNKVEDQINSSLAEAWARASGADEDQVAMLTQAVSFMRGKVAEKKIKSNMAQNNLQNAGMAVVAGGMMFATGGMSAMMMSGPMTALSSGVGGMFSGSMAAFGTIGLTQAMSGVAMGATAGVYRAVAGDKAADAMMNRMTGPKTQLAAIKANEQSIIQSNVTQAVATSTGLPAEVIGNMLTDYKGSKAAKKVRSAVNSNPLASIGTQAVGALGGLIKTAIVATGVPERDIQQAMSDGNSMLYAGSRDSNLQTQSLAYSSQALGMSAPGMSYTSATPTLKDKAGFVKELGQRMTVDALSVGMTKEEKEVLNSAFRSGYNKKLQNKADKKAQTSAIRSTAITAITTIATLGASAAASASTNAIVKTLNAGLQTLGAGSAQMGAAIVKLGVQVVDGSRNGKDGIAAGFINGAIGMVGAGNSAASALLTSSGLGLGVSYDRQSGWGGSIGIGGGSGNASVRFSQRGDTTLSAGANGATVNYNVSRQSYSAGYTHNFGNGFTLGATWDSNTGISGTAGFSQNGAGANITIGGQGISTSASLAGISLGTNGPNGFTPTEIDWVEQNLDQARDNVDARMAARARAAEDTYLAGRGVSPAEIAGMSPEQRNARIHALATTHDDDATTNEAAGTSRLGVVSRFVGGFTDAAANVANFYRGSASSTESMYVDPSGKVHPRTCFTAGTKIHTIEGLKNIEEIKVGDVVLSWNETTGEVSYKLVTELFLHEVELLYNIEINSSELIETTWNHPFWVINRDSWVEAKDLKIGDRVLLKSGEESHITGISSFNVPVTKVYNFEVEENHTYFVGKEGVLVHNYASKEIVKVAGPTIAACSAIIPACAPIGISILTVGLVGKIAYDIFSSDDPKTNPNKNLSSTQNDGNRDTSISVQDANAMRKQGLDPLNEKDVNNFKQKYEAKIQRKIEHIFDQEKHNFGPLLDKFGGDKHKAFKAIEVEAQKAYENNRLNLKNGINTETKIIVDGFEVDLIGGTVVDGRFEIGTASRREIK